jgi:hypothetical protein
MPDDPPKSPLKPRKLRIEPPSEAGGDWTLWDGDTCLYSDDRRRAVEYQRERDQASIDATGEPSGFVGGWVIDDEADALRAELEALRAPPSGDEETWRDYARQLIHCAPPEARLQSLPIIYEWAAVNWRFSERACPARSVFIQFLSDLRDEGLLPPSRRKSK